MAAILSLITGGLLHGAMAAPPCPGEVLDLSRWRLTLPVDTDRAGRPDEIRQPQLLTFADADFFTVNDSGDAVMFRAHCGGVPTRGSKFPRCELREIRREAERAWWSTSDRHLHTLRMRVAINKTPAVKQHVVCAQIHDDSDDLLMVRLEGSKLFVERNEVERVMLTRKYVLGTPFDLKIEAGQRRVRLWYNGELSMDWQVDRDRCYFKAGCYTQSTVERGDQPDALGEVAIYRLSVGAAKPNAPEPSD
ncbi:MAG: polysaccharide lyase family 7 protein [Planctomycetaceae bacterium]|nr:polysaccharide lyase family 7 protein [Planctomycetaceae bacterium]